jgi:hypothetical protein
MASDSVRGVITKKARVWLRFYTLNRHLVHDSDKKIAERTAMVLCPHTEIRVLKGRGLKCVLCGAEA